MATIAEIRQQYPQYKDMTDQQLADSLHQKFYSDMPREQFNQKVGFTPRGTGEYAAGLVDQFIQGAPVVGPAMQNASAAITAAAAPLYSETGDTSFTDRYAANRDFLRGRTKEFAQDNPIASTTANVAGALTALVALTRGNPQIAMQLGLTGPLGQQILRGALTGAGINAVDSTARGGDEWDALRAAGVGTALGVGGPLAVAGISKGVNAAGNVVRSAVAPFARSADDVAAGKVGTALARDGMDEVALNARVAELGPDGMLADASPNLRQQASTIAATPGRGQQIVRDAIRTRAEAAGDRVEQAATDALGQKANIAELTDDIIRRRKEAAAPLYEQAYATPFNPSPTILNILETPAGKTAQQYARVLSENEQVPFAMDVRGMDLIKRSFDDLEKAAKSKGAMNEARILGNMRTRLVAEVDAAVPKFKEARATFENESAIKDALENGSDVFNRKLNPAQLRKELSEMSEAEREAYLTGVRGILADIVGTARNDALAARQLFQRGYNREKLELLIGKQESDKFLNSLRSEGNFAGTEARVTNNSETAARAFGRADIEGLTPDLSMRGAFQAGGVGGLLRTGAVNLVEKALEAVRGRRNEDIQTAMATLLTARGVDRNAAIARLFQEARQIDRTGNYARQLGQILAGVRATQPVLSNR